MPPSPPNRLAGKLLRGIHPRRQRCVRLLFACVVLVQLLAGPTHALAREGNTEQEIMAALLFKFTAYIQWPDPSAAAPPNTFAICVLGDEPLRRELASFDGQTVNGKSVTVKRNATLEDAAHCQILVVGPEREDQLAAVIRRYHGSPLLTVGHGKDFAAAGGMVNFVSRDGAVRFEINPQAAKQAGLVISSKLLRLARIVGE